MLIPIDDQYDQKQEHNIVTRTGITFIVLVSSATLVPCGCASIDRFLETPKAKERRIELEQVREITDRLAVTCEVSPVRMSTFVTEIHESVTGNRVRDSFLLTAQSYRDAVRGAMAVQKQYGYERGPTETCQQVADDYTLARPRYQRLRNKSARQTVQAIIRMFRDESQGYRIRRIY